LDIFLMPVACGDMPVLALFVIKNNKLNTRDKDNFL